MVCLAPSLWEGRGLLGLLRERDFLTFLQLKILVIISPVYLELGSGGGKRACRGTKPGERASFGTESSLCAFPSTTDRLAALETWLSKPLPETLK